MRDFKKRLLSVFVLALFAVSTAQVFAKAPIPDCVTNGCAAFTAAPCGVTGACLMVPITIGYNCSCHQSPAGSATFCYCKLTKL